MKKYSWLKIDTASIMFSSLSSKEWGRTFRYSAYFDKNIDREKLERACRDLIPYYPSIYAYLKKGFFWNYLALTDKMPEIREEDERGMRPITRRDDGRPDFRLTYSDNRLNIECSHSLGDGKGIIVFFKALLARYNELMQGATGEYVTAEDPSININNAFADYYEPQGEKAKNVDRTAFHFEEKYEDNFLKLFFVETDIAKIKELAHKKQLTITEYITGILILAMIKSAKEPISQPVVIAVPVNLRRFFPTMSVRNFTIQTFIEFNPCSRTDWTLDDILEATKGQLRQQLKDTELKKTINKYGGLVNNPVLRIVPNAIKLPVLRKMQKKTHAGVSTIFTNYGACTLPEALAENVTKLEFVNGDTSQYGLAVTCSCIGYNGKLSLCFSHANSDTSWSEMCADIIKQLGAEVNIHIINGKGDNRSQNTEKVKEPFSAEKIKAVFNM